VVRTQRVRVAASAAGALAVYPYYLYIPAFLRRQAE
jgi:hypothetical protein